mmetsp:Transcript_31304/g.45631  ORF Transcript_31304/g.45631 Transcript_31304/m.45631 type:complete len:81 (-) Transcript_31304:751-993(-)
MLQEDESCVSLFMLKCLLDCLAEFKFETTNEIGPVYLLCVTPPPPHFNSKYAHFHSLSVISDSLPRQSRLVSCAYAYVKK